MDFGILLEYVCIQFSEVIVSDGGSTDGTIPALESLKAEWEEEPELLILRGEKGRGAQQNLGAERAGGSILAFLHADTWDGILKIADHCFKFRGCSGNV